NVLPGLIAAVATPFLLPRQEARLLDLAKLDGFSLLLAAAALASLEIALKDAPHDGWLSLHCAGLFFGSFAFAANFIHRSLNVADPVVDLSTLKQRPFAVGCALSFCLGVGLF